MQREGLKRQEWHLNQFESASDERLVRMHKHYHEQTELELKIIDLILVYQKVKEIH